MVVSYRYSIGDFVSARAPCAEFQNFSTEFMVVTQFFMDFNDSIGEQAYYHVIDREGVLRSFYEFSLIGESELLAMRLQSDD